jgi:hypothetical protein
MLLLFLLFANPVGATELTRALTAPAALPE